MSVPKAAQALIMTSAAVAIVSTPLYWLLGGPDSGELAAASVQGTTGVIALAWSLLTSLAATEPHAPGGADTATVTGRASAVNGGRAVTGVLRGRRTDAASARVEKSGDATAQGPDSVACSGVYRP
ncbi:hypothetical protein [Streptomyces zagrosensis]|uniref:Uncharacterized protein n=1 Tax=Streptomyces zagrosensis TaxID=1042984 RepID=A0A7W9QHF4_9ACTN|nr:hypothetical protein [Streptomyces zagrosensis]MBB5940340.1 hypothetical protein [Streptomyces zagrosensis]